MFPSLRPHGAGKAPKNTTCGEFGCLQEGTGGVSFPRGILAADLSWAMCVGDKSRCHEKHSAFMLFGGQGCKGFLWIKETA